MMNPQFGADEPVQTEYEWDPNVAGSMFYCESDTSENDEEIPVSWLIKYVIHYEDDNIDLFNKNGQFAFAPHQLAFNNFTSSLH